MKDIKIFLKKKKKKRVSIILIRTFLKKKKKKVEYIINYYLAENNYWVDLLIFRVLGQSKNSKILFIEKKISKPIIFFFLISKTLHRLVGKMFWKFKNIFCRFGDFFFFCKRFFWTFGLPQMTPFPTTLATFYFSQVYVLYLNETLQTAFFISIVISTWWAFNLLGSIKSLIVQWETSDFCFMFSLSILLLILKTLSIDAWPLVNVKTSI